MAVCFVGMHSYTYAVKAEKLLRLHGINAEVRHTSNSSEGCGYALFIAESCSKALDILRKNSVPFKKLSGGG